MRLLLIFLFTALSFAQTYEVRNPVPPTSNVLKGNGSGQSQAVSGTASDCLRVDGTSGPCGSASQNPTSGTYLVSGGWPDYTGTGLVYTVGAASYYINGTAYSSPITSITLDAADATNPRIDMIVGDTSGTVQKITGTADPAPVAPYVDPSLYVQFTTSGIYVPANSATPQTTRVLVYDENTGPATEWTCSTSGAGLNAASTNNPYNGTKDVEATAVVAGNYVECVAAAPFALSGYNGMVFYIRSKASWSNTRSIQMQWRNGSATVGNVVSLAGAGTFGFSSTVTSGYQQVVPALSLFNVVGNVDRIRFTMAGGGGTMGFYLDDISLQGGLTGFPNSYLTWRGTWNATVAYNVNDVVISSGTPYVAVAANTNSTPPSSNWAAMANTNTAAWGVNTVSFSATPTFDISAGTVQAITLTGDVSSSSLSNVTAGKIVGFKICQDGTGGRTFVWPAVVKGGMTIGTTLSTCSAQSFLSDGTNLYATSPGVINQ